MNFRLETRIFFMIGWKSANMLWVLLKPPITIHNYIAVSIYRQAYKKQAKHKFSVPDEEEMMGTANER